MFQFLSEKNRFTEGDRSDGHARGGGAYRLCLFLVFHEGASVGRREMSCSGRGHAGGEVINP